MINFYDKNRFISKSTLAKLADVSPRTFRRYLATRRHILDAMGISPKAQKLPPQAVRYICEDYCIDLPPELQDQEALSKSPLYQSFLRMLEERALGDTLSFLSSKEEIKKDFLLFSGAEKRSKRDIHPI